jgi:fibronectin type 3 domain-containing protein
VSGSAATVTLSGTSGGTTTADSSGSYTFSGLSNGSYVVAPSQSGYAFSPSTASVAISGSSLSGINFNSTAVVSHTVSLNWVASTSTDVLGYNVYRSTAAAGPYTKLTASVVAGTAYVDNNVAAGQTYYYVATAVDSSNSESEYSAQAAATVPTP